MRRSVYCTASFSICSLRRAKFPIIYPVLWLDYKVATHPFRIVPEGGSSVRRAAPPNAPRQSVTASHVAYLIAIALVILWILSHVH